MLISFDKSRPSTSPEWVQRLPSRSCCGARRSRAQLGDDLSADAWLDIARAVAEQIRTTSKAS
jgi:hypothetical protein